MIFRGFSRAGETPRPPICRSFVFPLDFVMSTAVTGQAQPDVRFFNCTGTAVS
jgi:hypothetical protein